MIAGLSVGMENSNALSSSTATAWSSMILQHAEDLDALGNGALTRNAIYRAIQWTSMVFTSENTHPMQDLTPAPEAISMRD